MRNVRIKGFTLIELMAVVAVVAILAAIAYPSFVESVRKSRRAQAVDGLINLRLQLEKARGNLTSYGDAVAGTHYNLPAAEYYNFSVDGGANATSFTVRAAAQAPQDKDSCGNFVLAVVNGEVQKSTTKYTDHTSDDAQRCWGN